MTASTVKPGLTRKRDKRVVENDDYASFARRILRAYARRVGDGDIEALAALRQLCSEVDTATAEAVKGLRQFGYSWADIAARLGVTRQAAQMRWGNRSERGRVDDRILHAGLGITVPVLVTVFADHFRDPLVGTCPGCGFEYQPDTPDCPTATVVRPMLFRRRHENPTAVARLTPAQFEDLHGRRRTAPRASLGPIPLDSGSSLFPTTLGGR